MWYLFFFNISFHVMAYFFVYVISFSVLFHCKTFSSSWLIDCLSLLFVWYCECSIYIFLTSSFLLDYFSPFLPLQAAVAATANTSTATSATTAGVPRAPGGLPQGALGSPSIGPASHNIHSVNEGTDWTDGYSLGRVSQPSSFFRYFVFGDLLLPTFLPLCIYFSSFSSSHLYF